MPSDLFTKTTTTTKSHHYRTNYARQFCSFDAGNVTVNKALLFFPLVSQTTSLPSDPCCDPGSPTENYSLGTSLQRRSAMFSFSSVLSSAVDTKGGAAMEKTTRLAYHRPWEARKSQFTVQTPAKDCHGKQVGVYTMSTR